MAGQRWLLASRCQVGNEHYRVGETSYLWLGGSTGKKKKDKARKQGQKQGQKQAFTHFTLFFLGNPTRGICGDVRELQNCKALQVAWRVRPGPDLKQQVEDHICNKFLVIKLLVDPRHSLLRLETTSSGSKLMPLRPVCVLIGNLQLQPNQVVQIM